MATQKIQVQPGAAPPPYTQIQLATPMTHMAAPSVITCPSCNGQMSVATGTPPGAAIACPHCRQQVQVPGAVPMATPMATSVGQAPAQQKMEDCPAIVVKQKLQLIEAFCPICEKRNKYKIKALQDLSVMEEEWDEDQWDSLPPFMRAKEESDVCCRICCQKWREFDMDILPSNDQSTRALWKFHRPFKTNYSLAGAAWPLCPCLCLWNVLSPNEITATDGAGQDIGRVQHDWRCSTYLCCWNCYWKAYDAEGQVQYVFRDQCCAPNCWNCCAPNCICEKHHIDILNADETEVVGQLTNLFPGCNCKMLNMTSHYRMVFPKDADENKRALLLAGLMLIEFMLFEKEDNNNN